MRTPAFCTLTGADDGIEIRDLFRLSVEFPFVEWGILFHAEHHGFGRYPSPKWIEYLCNQMSSFPDAHFALHICGQEAIGAFLRGDGCVTRLATAFRRIQLNLVAKNVDLKMLIGAIQRYPDKMLITQHNATNEGLCQLLNAVPNHAVLFDESGGLGISPTAWPYPLQGKLCGYAGGLGPDNLATELPRIQSAA
jgi:hypothetical protein